MKKGDDEYIVIASGSTGLTGKYWQDIDKLPPRRRCTITPPPTTASPTPNKAGEKRKATTTNDETPAKKGRKSKETEDQQERSPKGRGAAGGGGAKRKAAAAASSSEDEQTETERSGTPTQTNGTAAAAASAATPAQRNISCLSDSNATGSQQREVVVECFAPYDDHRWVNIGKEKNGAAPDAVQYARALRPPYQLLSFLRIKGNCSKGTGCSNKNTMVSICF